MEHKHPHTPNGKRRLWYGGFAALAFLVLFGFITVKYVFQARRANDELIAQHVEKLKNIFKDINDTAKINGFRHEKAYIDFLNVASFEGSVVGPMSLLEPKNWKGPYLKESLTIEGVEYQIIGTRSGYFILPGDGVKLGNGKVIGKTLLITPTSDIPALLRDPNALLSSNNKTLGALIEMYQNPAAALKKGEIVNDNEPVG